MSAVLKIPRRLLDHALADLHKSHAHAAERVGFLACRHATTTDGPTLFSYAYLPVEDDHYERDRTCGARIGGQAIRSAMEHALAEGCTLLHVHTHGNSGQPEPSSTDKSDLPGIAASIHNVLPSVPHGWVVLSKEGMVGEIHFPSGRRAAIRDLRVVGNPMLVPRRPDIPTTIWQRLWQDIEPIHRHSRQRFLGVRAHSIISSARIGVVGLCGGGSHIVQQLAHIGVRRFVLCDDDQVEATNINRLVGATLHDVRKRQHKTRIAERVIRNIQPISHIDSAPDRWQQKMEHLKTCDAVFACLDSFQSRRDLEAFCRRHFVPLIDIGMNVAASGGAPEIYGQVVLSLPGEPCLHCAGVLTERSLSQEAQHYGDAGPQPQVVWPNGVLASTAIGIFMQLLTGWTGNCKLPYRLDYQGSRGLLQASPICSAITEGCVHYPLGQAGDPQFRTP